MLVDDEEPFRDTLARVLQRRGFDVTCAGTAEECLEMLRSAEVDVVLLDLQIPGMGGMAALPEIVRRRPAARVVVLTGHGTLALGIQAMKAHAFDFLSKPVMIDELVSVIREAVAARERGQG